MTKSEIISNYVIAEADWHFARREFRAKLINKSKYEAIKTSFMNAKAEYDRHVAR